MTHFKWLNLPHCYFADSCLCVNYYGSWTDFKKGYITLLRKMNNKDICTPVLVKAIIIC